MPPVEPVAPRDEEPVGPVDPVELDPVAPFAPLSAVPGVRLTDATIPAMGEVIVAPVSADCARASFA